MQALANLCNFWKSNTERSAFQMILHVWTKWINATLPWFDCMERFFRQVQKLYYTVEKISMRNYENFTLLFWSTVKARAKNFKNFWIFSPLPISKITDRKNVLAEKLQREFIFLLHTEKGLVKTLMLNTWKTCPIFSIVTKFFQRLLKFKFFGFLK